MDNNLDVRWITDRLDALEPTWSPEAVRAHAALQRQLARKRPRRWWLAVPALVAASLAAALIPQTRSFAQEIWARWTVGRFAVVPVELPETWHVSINGAVKEVVDVRDAASAAGFAPALPSSSSEAGQPALSVLPRFQMSQTIDVRAMRERLQRIGATDVQVPDAWDKVELRADVGPIFVAEYPDGAVLAQARPFPLYVPVGMPLTDIANAILRSAGMPAAEAKTMALAYAIQPAWVLDIAKTDRVRVEQTTLSNGPAVVIEDLSETTPAERVIVLRSTPERLFLAVGPTRERAVGLAEGVR